MNKVFKGRIYTYYFVLIFLVIIVIFVNYKNFELKLFLGELFLVILMTYALFGIGYNYIIINNDKLIIRNLFFWWKEERFNINQLESLKVFFRPDGHVVIKINKRRYTCNSLSIKDTIEFVDILKELANIEVEFPQDPRKKDEFD